MLDPKGVVGLGKLGTPLAALLAADVCHNVIGLDTSDAVVKALADGSFRSCEPGLDDLLQRAKSRLDFTTDYGRLVTGTDMAFVVVPTPSTPEAPAFDASYVLEAVGKIAVELVRHRVRDYVVVLVSTVMPGTCDNVIRPVLESLTSEAPQYCPKLVYSPEFIALGNVINGLRLPDFLLIGSDDTRSASRVNAVLRSMINHEVPTHLVSRINAEIAKLSINAALGWKITLGNMLAQVCDGAPGADCDEVAKILGSDSRIGPKLLRGGMGFGGPCLPRDIRAIGARLPLDTAEMLEAIGEFNERLVEHAVRPLQCDVRIPGPVAVVGLAYKDGTPVLEDSQPLQAALLLADNYDVHVCDSAIAAESQVARSLPRFKWFNSVADCVAGCKGVLLAKLTSQAAEISKLQLTPPCVVVDCWRQLAKGSLPDGVTHIAFGRGD